MAGNAQEILREYLVALGYKVDETGGKKFDGAMVSLDKKAMGLSKSLVGVTTTMVAMTTEFAFRMERLYYSSRLAQSAAGNLQAIQFAGKQSGIANMTENVMSMTRALRANPGLYGLLHMLGVKVEGRDRAEVLMDLVKSLKSMPFYVAQQYAAMFGISPDDLLLMEEAGDKLKENYNLRKQIAGDLGIDTDAAAKAGLEYSRQWREILMYVGLFRDALSLELLPAMENFAGVVKQVLTDWVHIVQTPRESFVHDLKEGLGLEDRDGVKLSADAKARIAGKKGLSPAEQKVEDELPYHAPEGNVGIAKGVENWLRWRARRGAIQRGEIPPDPPEAPEKEAPSKPYVAPAGNTGLAKMYEDYTYWRENRGRKARGLPPLPSPTDAERAAAHEPAEALPGISKPPAPALPAPAAESPPRAPKKAASAPRPTQEQTEFLASLEKARGLPAGTLDALWKREASYRTDRDLISPKGAEGPFQFMPATGAAYGLKRGEAFDLKKAGKAAGDYIGDLYKKYGDMRYAFAAYNWNEQKLDALLGKAMEKMPNSSQKDVDRYVLGHLPEETRRYIAGIGAEGPAQGAGVQLQSETNINVYETGSAQDTGREIADAQRSVNSDLVRQFAPRMN